MKFILFVYGTVILHNSPNLHFFLHEKLHHRRLINIILLSIPSISKLYHSGQEPKKKKRFLLVSNKKFVKLILVYLIIRRFHTEYFNTN